MGDVLIPGLKRQTPKADAHGNLNYARAKYAVDLAQNDVLSMLRMPRGTVLLDCILITSALGASVTCDVGIRAVGAGAKGDDDALVAAADVSAAALVRRTRAAVPTDSGLVLDDDDYDVILTLEGANPASNGVYELILIYGFEGTK